MPTKRYTIDIYSETHWLPKEDKRGLFVLFDDYKAALIKLQREEGK